MPWVTLCLMNYWFELSLILWTSGVCICWNPSYTFCFCAATRKSVTLIWLPAKVDTKSLGSMGDGTASCSSRSNSNHLTYGVWPTATQRDTAPLIQKDIKTYRSVCYSSMKRTNHVSTTCQLRSMSALKTSYKIHVLYIICKLYAFKMKIALLSLSEKSNQ